jgi:hypothetical protein
MVALKALSMLPAEVLEAHTTAIVGRLEDPDLYVRMAAVKALSMLPTAALEVHATAIAGRLEDADWDVRVAALVALAKLPTDALAAHATAIAGRLKDPDGDVREAAVEALAMLPAKALELLETLEMLPAEAHTTASVGKIGAFRRAHEDEMSAEWWREKLRTARALRSAVTVSGTASSSGDGGTAALVLEPPRRKRKHDDLEMHRATWMSVETSACTKLYHQTDAATADIILRTQHIRSGSTSGLFGSGIYFATTPELTGHKAHKNAVILEALVALGKTHSLDANVVRNMTLQTLKSSGYDSVCLAASSGQEYVVFDPKQVLFLQQYFTSSREPPPASPAPASIG